MKLHYIILPVICILFSGCNLQIKRDTEKISEFYIIDFEQSFETEQQVFISEIADSIEYIELKTPEDITITRIWRVMHIDDYLVVRASLYTYLFHKNGEFISRIGNIGQGPGEYLAALDIEFDAKRRELVIADTKQLLFYDLSGKFLRSQRMKDISEIGISDSVLWIGETLFSPNQQKYKAIAVSLNGKGDTLATIPNPLYNTLGTDKIGFVGSPLTSMFYHRDDLLYFKGDGSNDTIWKIAGTNREPYVFIDMGKYKLPIEYEPWHTSSEIYFQHCGRYWDVASLVEDNNYFFLYSRNLKSTKDNRILKYILYDKKKKTGFVANDTNDMGMTDDILGGPPVWMRWASDEYYINSIEAYQLLEKFETGVYNPSAPLKDFLSTIGEDTNELIILCRRKKAD